MSDDANSPQKWAAAFIKAYDERDTTTDRHMFVADWFSQAMNETRRSMEKDPLRTMLSGALTGDEQRSFGELIAMAKRRLEAQ